METNRTSMLTETTSPTVTLFDGGVPVIDLAPLFQEQQHEKEEDDSNNSRTTGSVVDPVVAAIAQACADPGFFQVINHGISTSLIHNFRTQCQLYFELDRETKLSMKRLAGNSRGYFDDELTKQKRDWKECLDMGVPGNGKRDWNVLPDDAPENECLDGFNQLPVADVLPDYRRVAVEYFDACAKLSQRLAVAMAQGLGHDKNLQHDPFIVDLEKTHTSYLRSNYYPPCPEISISSSHDDDDDQEIMDPASSAPEPLGISPHKDAGFLTVLLQDDDCHSLQVLRRCHKSNNGSRDNNDNNNGDNHKDCYWMTVHPIPGALTINTGDMAQVWSNNKYQAPLHRVLANRDKVRYSAPFFYNPGYQTVVEPAMTTLTAAGAMIATDNSTSNDDDDDDNDKGMMMILPRPPEYHGILWGYFRAIRFAGDLTDLGVEIQISDFCKKKNPENEERADGNSNNHISGRRRHEASSASRHLIYQKVFQERGLTSRAFNVDDYREILKEIDEEKKV
jgi:isopenicillin N synthase-like dioxygenase